MLLSCYQTATFVGTIHYSFNQCMKNLAYHHVVLKGLAFEYKEQKPYLWYIWLRVNLINVNSITETCLWVIPLHPCLLFHSESFSKHCDRFLFACFYFVYLFCFDSLKPDTILVSLTSCSFLKRAL